MGQLATEHSYKKIYRINKKELVKKFPIKQIDYPNNVNQDDLKFYY